MRRTPLILLSLLLTAVLLSACGGDTDPAPGGNRGGDMDNGGNGGGDMDNGGNGGGDMDNGGR